MSDASADTSTPESVPPAAEPAPAAAALPSPEQEVATAKKDAAENYDRYVRAMAEMDNLRRRMQREKEELRQYASARVLEDLLPALDTLALGLAAAKAPNADLKTLVGGIDMVAGQLKSSLAGHGLVELNPLGQPFDPNLHEALTQQPSADVPEGSVLQVIRTGYTLNGRLLRPASVIVSAGPAAS